MIGQKRLPAAFWRTTGGAEPVREWLRALKKHDRLVIGEAVKTVEFGWPVGMPTCRSMGQGMFEVRVDLAQARTARILFCVHEKQMILLHSFIKKNQKTPKADLDLARKRKRELENPR
jgi:phage-related protein